MSSSQDHTKWFTILSTPLQTSDGKGVTLLEFKPDLANHNVMSSWAKHFRNHYCFDEEIDYLRTGPGLSSKDYLLRHKFPSSSGFGPGIRSGDFSEILVADYIEFVLGVWVPRTRYGIKTIRDESTKGSDLIGFTLVDDTQSPKDVLTMFEVKAQFSGNRAKDRLQDSINDSVKDDLRLAESLNAMNHRLFDKGKLDDAKKVARFQNELDRPFKKQFGAAALYSTDIFIDDVITKASTKGHPFRSNIFLIVIKGDEMMNLVNRLYQIAADEA